MNEKLKLALFKFSTSNSLVLPDYKTCYKTKKVHLRSVLHFYAEVVGKIMAIDFSRLDIIVYVLAVEYAILVLVPIAQLLRICIRIPDVGWTTQKLFLVLTMLSSLGKKYSQSKFKLMFKFDAPFLLLFLTSMEISLWLTLKRILHSQFLIRFLPLSISQLILYLFFSGILLF